jgi:hypothetical protein
MAEPVAYIPSHPKYIGNQIIVSSGRVTLHSKDDSTMIFGKKAIALSSLGSVNFDVTTKLIINSPKIILGIDADITGEPVLLGKGTVLLISRLLDKLTVLGTALTQLSETELEKAIPAISFASTELANLCPKLRADLESLLSTVTYTK